MTSKQEQAATLIQAAIRDIERGKPNTTDLETALTLLQTKKSKNKRDFFRPNTLG